MATNKAGGEWFSVSLKGFEETRKLMELLPDKIQRNAMKQAMAAGARKILQEARRRVPVRTGELKKSLEVKFVKAASQGTFGKIVYKVQAKRPQGSHANLVELGTTRAQPHPFLRPAFDVAKDQALAAIMEKLSKAILKEATKGKRK